MKLPNCLLGRTLSLPAQSFFWLMTLGLGVLFPFELQAAKVLKGLVVNGTDQHPLGGQKVELLVLGAGMQNTSDTTTNSAGEFQFSLSEETQTPHWLLRAIYRGVNYNLTVTPDQNLNVPVKLMVYEPTTSMTGIHVSLPLMLAQASGSQLFVQQQYFLTNESVPPKTLVISDGSFLFDTPSPELVSELNVAVVGGMGIPLPQNPVRRQEGGYAIKYPMKPGKNEIRISYKVNFSSNQREFAQRLYYGPLNTRLLVLPSDLQLTGSGVKAAGTDSMTKAAAYEVSVPAKEKQLQLRITGEAPQISESSEKGPSEGMEQESELPGMKVVRLPNPVFENWLYLVSGFGLIFAVILALAVRQSLEAKARLKEKGR
ncbi:MAG: hypothetical protein U0V70_06375 [Terriglobia bacterium]